MQTTELRLIATAALALAVPAAGAVPRIAGEFPLRAPRAPALYVATTAKPDGEALAVFAWAVFEGEPYAGTLAVMAGEGPPFELGGIWSAALDESWEKVVVGEEIKVIDNTVDPPFARTGSYCRQLGMDAAALREALYFDGFMGNGYITRPVIYEVASGEREALPVAGGDFIDWAGPSRLVVGRERGGSKRPGRDGLELFGYNVDSGAITPLAGRGEAVAKLGDKLSADVGDSPYLPQGWRLAATSPRGPGVSFPEIPIPGRDGFFESRGGRFFWREEGGEAAAVGEGVVVAASGNGDWIVVFREGASRPLTAMGLTWE